jgi:hypothetical protein
MFQHGYSASLHKIWCWHDVLLSGFQWSNESCCTKHIHMNKNVIPSGQIVLDCEGEWSLTEDNIKLSIHRTIKILERGFWGWHWHEVASPWIKRGVHAGNSSKKWTSLISTPAQGTSYTETGYFLKVSTTIIGHFNPQN